VTACHLCTDAEQLLPLATLAHYYTHHRTQENAGGPTRTFSSASRISSSNDHLSTAVARVRATHAFVSPHGRLFWRRSCSCFQVLGERTFSMPRATHHLRRRLPTLDPPLAPHPPPPCNTAPHFPRARPPPPPRHSLYTLQAATIFAHLALSAMWAATVHRRVLHWTFCISLHGGQARVPRRQYQLQRRQRTHAPLRESKPFRVGRAGVERRPGGRWRRNAPNSTFAGVAFAAFTYFKHLRWQRRLPNGLRFLAAFGATLHTLRLPAQASVYLTGYHLRGKQHTAPLTRHSSRQTAAIVCSAVERFAVRRAGACGATATHGCCSKGQFPFLSGTALRSHYLALRYAFVCLFCCHLPRSRHAHAR